MLFTSSRGNPPPGLHTVLGHRMYVGLTLPAHAEVRCVHSIRYVGQRLSENGFSGVIVLENGEAALLSMQGWDR